MARVHLLEDCLRNWVNHFAVGKRWPCPECGRESESSPKLANTVITNGGRRTLEGCHLCNLDWLINSTRELL